MKHLTPILVFSILSTNLIAQGNLDLLTDHEWLSTSRGFHKHYLFKFDKGKIRSEFSASDWNKYIVRNGHLIIHNNDNILYKDFYDTLSKEFNFDKSSYDTALFKINNLSDDSLILDPINLRAKELSYYFNRSTFRKDSTSLINPGLVKFYNRKLSYQSIPFDVLTITNSSRQIKINQDGKYVVQNPERKKSKSTEGQLDKKQLDELFSLLEKSNIIYYKTADTFENRIDIKGTRTWKKLILTITKNDDYIQIKTDYHDIPWTIKPLIDFSERLNK